MCLYWRSLKVWIKVIHIWKAQSLLRLINFKLLLDAAVICASSKALTIIYIRLSNKYF